MARSVRRPALGLATLSHDFRNLRESLRRFEREALVAEDRVPLLVDLVRVHESLDDLIVRDAERARRRRRADGQERSEEHTSELQSQSNLVCRLLLEKKKYQ